MAHGTHEAVHTPKRRVRYNEGELIEPAGSQNQLFLSLGLTPGRSLMFHSPEGEQKLRGRGAELVENTTRIGPELAGERLLSAPKGRDADPQDGFPALHLIPALGCFTHQSPLRPHPQIGGKLGRWPSRFV